MIVIIAMLSGLYDVAGLIMAFALTAVMNLCGLLMEMYNRGIEKISWVASNIGSLAGILPWLAIAIYFFGSTSSADGGIPTFVYFILPTLSSSSSPLPSICGCSTKRSAPGGITSSVKEPMCF
jgi:hypothetical protein